MASKIEWAPLNIPFERRIQTLTVLIALGLQVVLILFSFVLLFIFPIPMILYLTFMYFDKAPTNGIGRRKEWFRNLKFFRHFSNYFPSKMHKTVDLDPSKHYIFGYHPHGIISIGAFSNFATNGTGFSELFPGIRCTLMTLSAQFYTPIWREILMALGVGDVRLKSCLNCLRQEPGSSIMIVIGGANEALYAKPGTAELTIKKRKGFVKLALTDGASLVPVFGFGENELWDQIPNPPGSKVRKVQDLLKDVITFTIPLVNGRGIFQYGYGLLPHRRKVNVVVGPPIDCPKMYGLPDSEEFKAATDKYHALYLEALKKLYDDNKEKFGQGNVELKFVE